MDLIDEDQVTADLTEHRADRGLVMSVMFRRLLTGRPRNRANSAASIRGVAAGGTVT